MYYFLIFVFGAVIGSFINVLACRLVTGESIIWPPSNCDKCKKRILSHDLIPIVSFALLGGKCRFCGSKISWRYPVVEIITGALFLLFFLKIGAINWQLVVAFISISALTALFITDLRAMVLPDQITIPAIVTIFLIDFFILKNSLRGLSLAVVIGGGFFALQYFVSRGRFMGSGDIRLGILMGVVLQTWDSVLLALAVSYILGAAISIVLLATKRKNLKSEVPMGVFLVIGTIFVMLFYDKLALFISQIYW